MGTALFLSSLLATFLFYDVMLRVAILLRPGSRFEIMSKFQHRAARRVLGQARAFCSFRLRVSRYPGGLPRQCLVVANHQSLVDIPVLMAALPSLDLRFVAKRELRRRVPGVSMTLRAAEHALIGRRSGLREAGRALRGLARLASRGVSPVVFPEGTRSRSGAVEEFHAAAVRILAEQTRLPILSVAIEGGHRISRLKDMVRNLGGASYRIAPLRLSAPPRTRAELANLLAAAREEIAMQIAEWRATGDDPPAARRAR